MTVERIEVVVRAWLDPIANAFTTFGLWAIIIIVRLFLSFFLLFVSCQMGGNMTHIALLGDSVIDNGAYVGRGPDVAEQVRNLVPDEWKVTPFSPSP